MANIVYPNTFVATTPAVASQVNANFSAITDVVNGAIEAVNLAAASVITAKLADAAVTTIKLADAAVTSAKLATGIDAAKLGDGSVSNTEFQYLNGVTSAIQTQLDGKLATGTTYAGRIKDPSDGYGFAAATSLPTGWSVVMPDGIATNEYEITHNLGTTNYVIVVTALDGYNANDPHTFHVTTTGTNMVSIAAKTGTSVGQNVSFGFILHLL